MTKSRIRISAVAAFLAALPMSLSSHAETLPLWEIGAGVAVLSLPDYRGSAETGAYVLPIPYFVYRGELLKVDRGGLSGLLFDSDRIEVDLSLNGTIPVNSEDNPLRRGMADLEPAVELGPTVNVHLWRSPDRKTTLDFRMPVRAAITVEPEPRKIGWLFSPNLDLEMRDPAGFSGWKLGFQLGPYFNDREYNAYFYSVDPSAATPERPAYSAQGGYSGSQVFLSLSKRFPHYWVGGFIRHDNLAGVVFERSPLVESRDAFSAGLALSWVFGESSRRVAAE
ncbi:MAG: hypothetical protein QG662_1916 [Pseudomonadota bacterium]|nr:hypothetical protein [Pseudomonadota bacterium]